MLFLANCYTQTRSSDHLISSCAAQQDILHSRKFKRKLRQQQSLLGRGMVRGLLAHTTKTESGKWDLVIPDKGPLVARSTTDNEIWFFSISHSHQFVIAAISNSGPIGVDTESVASDRDMAQLLGGVNPDGADALPQTKQGQYLLWTRHEAYCKARYQHMTFPIPEQLLFTSTDDMISEESDILEIDGLNFAINSRETDGYVYSICQQVDYSGPLLPQIRMKSLADDQPVLVNLDQM